MMKRYLVATLLASLPANVHADTLCDPVAVELRDAAGRNPRNLPGLDDMPAVATPGPQFAPMEAATEQENRAELKRRFNAAGPEFENAPFGSSMSVTGVGRTGPISLWDVEGTAHCSYYSFLMPHASAPAEHVPEPPLTLGNDLCWTSSGWLGDLKGRPVFAVENRDRFAPAETIEIVPWEGRAWGQSYAVEAQFEPIFSVSFEAYADPSWSNLKAIAPEIAASRHTRDQDSSFAYGAAGDEARFNQMVALTEKAGVDLPRFGKAPDGYDTFDSDAPYFPLVINGKTYLARVGHGTLGWRVSPDYLLAVWDLLDGKLQPIAGLVVSTLPGKLTSLRVSRAISLTPE